MVSHKSLTFLAAAFVAAAFPCFSDSLPNPNLHAPYPVFYDFGAGGQSGLTVSVRALVPDYIETGTTDLTNNILYANIYPKNSDSYRITDYSITGAQTDPIYTPSVTVLDQTTGQSTTFSYGFLAINDFHDGNLSGGMGNGSSNGFSYNLFYLVSPEPSSLLLMGTGLFAVLFLMRHRFSKP